MRYDYIKKMKSRFTTIDLCASISELRQRLLGMRVINVYDNDSKTYLIKLQRPEEKAMLLIESGNRMHSTEFEWPKSTFPSGFAIKLRKHLKQKRLVAVTQLGIDRIVDLQFGSNEVAHHLIVEFYDRGNIVLTDHDYLILSLLRRRTEKGNEERRAVDEEGEATTKDVKDENIEGKMEEKSQGNEEVKEGKAENEKDKCGNKSGENKSKDVKGKGKNGDTKAIGYSNEDVKFSVGQTYPVGLAKQRAALVSIERLKEILDNCKEGELLKKALNPHFIYGHTVLEHCLLEAGLPAGVTVGKDCGTDNDVSKVMEAITMADRFLDQALSQSCKGYIIQKREKNPSKLPGDDVAENELITYQEFHPFLFRQHKAQSFSELPSFDKSVDEFFSKIGSQKLDIKALNQQKAAMKKSENVKRDHVKRIHQLQLSQDEDTRKAELVEVNLPLVDQAILVVNSAIANQIDWSEIRNIVKEAQSQDDLVACAIKELKLETNHMTMVLRDPFDNSESDDEEENEDPKKKKKNVKGVRVDINLALSAYANARSYYVKKKYSAKKEQKTIDQSEQALKSAEKKAIQTLKEVATITNIRKARKTYWFEKFLWFISSENYVVIGGRDQQQNELVVKRHLVPGDVYVHAELHGASSVIVKNKPGGQSIPPKTLMEAGTMAVCHSAGWDSKIVTSAWWVYHHQVSKTAPTGEYLTTGSFMIRGKKNFLPPTHLIMGFGFLFRVEDACIERHRNERRIRGLDDTESIADSTADTECDEELSLGDLDSDTEDRKEDETGDDVTERGSDVMDAATGKDPEESDDALDSRYPDTSISLQIVSGKLKLQRGVSNTSSQQDDDEIFLGDEHKINLKENKEKAFQVTKQRLAKQKRGQRGGSKEGEVEQGGEEQEEQQQQEQQQQEQQHKKGGPQQQQHQQQPQQQQQQQQQQMKKGKKAKLKKMKEKYGDQDEEERNMRMEILASAGPAKETKADKRRAKKANKGGKESRPGRKPNYRQQNITPLPWEQAAKQGENPAEETLEDEAETPEIKSSDSNQNSTVKKEADDNEGDNTRIENDNGNKDMNETREGVEKNISLSKQAKLSDAEPLKASGVRQDWEEGPASTRTRTDQEGSNEQVDKASTNSGKEKFNLDDEDDDDDNPQDASKENASLLDALTGCPVVEDMLLFSIPVCAPYTAIQNYKYKVKLTPGIGRKGKATKTALNAFIYTREASQREKDLLKSVKDTDLSRNIPGKVKVSAPNLQRRKRK